MYLLPWKNHSHEVFSNGTRSHLCGWWMPPPFSASKPWPLTHTLLYVSVTVEDPLSRGFQQWDPITPVWTVDASAILEEQVLASNTYPPVWDTHNPWWSENASTILEEQASDE